MTYKYNTTHRTPTKEGADVPDDKTPDIDHTGDNRPNIYPEADRIILRASSIGGCTRSLIALMLGHDPAPPPEFMQKAYDEGNANEPVILNLLRTRELDQEDRHGVKATVEYRMLTEYEVESQGFGAVVGGGEDGTGGQLEVEVYGITDADGKQWVVRGHTDGIAQAFKLKLGGEANGLNLRDRVVVEAKAFSEGTYRKWRDAAEKGGLAAVWEAFPYYGWQASVYSCATGLPVLFVIGVKDADGVVQDIVTYLVPLDEMPFGKGKIKARVAKIKRGVEEGRVDIACDQATYPCPVFYLHDEDHDGERSREVRLRQEDIPDVGTLQLILAEYAEVRREEKALKKKREEGDAILKQWIKDHPEMEGDDVYVEVGGGEKVKLRVKVEKGGEREMTEKEKEAAKKKWEDGKVRSNGRTTITAEVVGKDEGDE